MNEQLLLATLLTLTAGSLSAQDYSTPLARVEHTVNQVFALLNDDSLDQETRWEKVALVINDSFYFPGMSQSILATNWKKLPEAEQQQFVEYFSRYLELIYREKIEAYTNEKVVYGEVLNRGSFAFVETFIITDTVKIPVHYKLKDHAGVWFAYDVEIEGVSLVANYRLTFAEIIGKKGMDGLFEHLEARVAKSKASS
jgi:phospholipid transport system substrate-binding protein